MRSFDALDVRGQVQRLRQLARTALSHYAINVAQLALLQYRHNAIFRVTTAEGERFVLRIHAADHYQPDTIRAEAEWLMALRRDLGLRVPEPVPAVDGQPVVSEATAGIEAPRCC